MHLQVMIETFTVYVVPISFDGYTDKMCRKKNSLFVKRFTRDYFQPSASNCLYMILETIQLTMVHIYINMIYCMGLTCDNVSIPSDKNHSL